MKIWQFILKNNFNLKNKNIKIKGSSLLILGYAYKENCPDIRNSKVINLSNEAQKGILQNFMIQSLIKIT